MIPTIKVVCVIEATTVTGPAKNLLNFCRLARSTQFREAGLPRIEVSIVTFQRLQANSDYQGGEVNKSAPNSFVSSARAEGVEVDVIEEGFRFDPGVIKKLRRVIAQRSPDIIETRMIKSHFLIKLTGLGEQYPWVAFHHGYTTTDLKMRAYNQLNRWSLPSATRVITVCDAFAKQLSQTGVRADRITVCHNSVTAPRRVTSDERHVLKNKLGLAEDEPVVLAVGRLSREKGHGDLIEAAALLHEMNPALKFKLIFVGDGPERERLERAAVEAGLSGRTLFIGQVEDIAPFYAIADALALPSHSEGSPNVLLEAMAGGVPVVATNVGGVPEIAVAEESGLLVPAHNPRLFAEAMQRILTDPELGQMIRENAKLRVATHFSPESYAQSLMRIYQELLPANTKLAEPHLVSA